jgi:hypothetical protein
MTSTRVRAAVTLAVAAALLTALTACAPPVHTLPKAGAFSTATPRFTPRPIATRLTPATKPASDYSFACSDLIGASALPNLLAAAVTPVLASKLDRENKLDSLPNDYYVEVLGGLDCDWADNQPITSDTSHNMALHLLPVDSSVWTKFTQSVDGATATTYTACTTAGSGGQCQYDAFTNGTWWQLDINNMKPSTTSADALPTAVQTVVNAIAAKISGGPAAETNGTQKGLRPLPAESSELITAAQVKSALALPASATVTVDCDDQADGPWTITAEAATEITGALGCDFDTPDGGIYGSYQVLSGGGWAAKDAIANTPGETLAITVNTPVDTDDYIWTDYQAGHDEDLIDYGNWIALSIYAPDSSEPASGVSASLALQNLSFDVEAAIGHP